MASPKSQCLYSSPIAQCDVCTVSFLRNWTRWDMTSHFPIVTSFNIIAFPIPVFGVDNQDEVKWWWYFLTWLFPIWWGPNVIAPLGTHTIWLKLNTSSFFSSSTSSASSSSSSSSPSTFNSSFVEFSRMCLNVYSNISRNISFDCVLIVFRSLDTMGHNMEKGNTKTKSSTAIDWTSVLDLFPAYSEIFRQVIRRNL